jgi:peptidyl-prolyl cis-trans isomerase D
MFNIVERHQKLVKGIMITLTATFVVWGISGYLGMTGDDGYIAKVGSKRIYGQDIDRAMDSNPNQPQDKMQVLFGLINRQLLVNALEDNHLTATTSELQQAIAAIPLFQTDGSFDVTKYQQFLKTRYLSSAKFEQEISEQILISQMVDFFKNSYFTSDAYSNKFAQLLSRQRNVSRYVIDPRQFYSKVNLTESEIAADYQQNLAKYTLAEQVKLEYLTLSAEQIAAAIKVTNEEVARYIQDHPQAASTAQIDVSHILFSVPSGATAVQKAQVKQKAMQILAKVRANPGDFAKLAKQYSQDPGSAANGGDLGYFGKGVMVKPFEEVAFNLKKGQISDLVETPYGYHILKLIDTKATDQKLVQEQAIKQLQKQKAQQQLATMVEKLNDLSYNQPDSLRPAAQNLNLSLQQSDWVNKGATQGLFANPKLQTAIFSADVIKARHNSEVVDLGNGSYVVARVAEYQPARVKPLAEVRQAIVASLTAARASQLAAAAGQNDLNLLQKGKVKLEFTRPENVTLLGQSPDIEPLAVRQIFAQKAQFPAYTGTVARDGSYVIYRINSQSTDQSLNSQNQRIISQLSDQYAMITLSAYVGALRSQYKVSYKLDRIQNNANAQGGSN